VKTKQEMGEKFQNILFDIDGVLKFQGKAYPGAVELLEVLRKKEIKIRILLWIQ
jgi:ribonucleotide monophosphatase NagD (HAD superfamily)